MDAFNSCTVLLVADDFIGFDDVPDEVNMNSHVCAVTWPRVMGHSFDINPSPVLTCFLYNAMTCEVEHKLLALELSSMMKRVCVQRSLQKDIREKNSDTVPCIFMLPSMYYSLGLQWLFSEGLFSSSPCFPCDWISFPCTLCQ